MPSVDIEIDAASAMAAAVCWSVRSALLVLVRMRHAVPRAVMGNVKSPFNRIDHSNLI